MPCAAAAAAASEEAADPGRTSTAWKEYLRSIAFTASKTAACTSDIARVCTGTGAPAVSVARMAIVFQSVTASARAVAAASKATVAHPQLRFIMVGSWFGEAGLARHASLIAGRGVRRREGAVKFR